MSIQYLPSGGCEVSGKELAQRATLSRLKDFLRRRIDALRKYRDLRKEWQINRLAFQHLLYLDDRILEDIGVTREDVRWANKLPLKKNAALELRKIARTKCQAAHQHSAKQYWL